MDALTINEVSKTFGKLEAVKKLSFRVEQGTIYGLLGPNGAGKTTTIRMIMQIIMPDSGEIRIFGQPNSTKLLDQVGYLPEERGLYRKMKVLETLLFFGALKRVRGSDAEKEARHWLERFEMTEVSEKKLEELSKGNQQKIQIIATLMHKPRLVILDEPFSGLDPVNAQLIKDVMLEMKNAGCCIIFSTHLMEQVEKLCSGICLINKGQRVLEGQLSEIKKGFGKKTVALEFNGENGFFDRLDFVERVQRQGARLEVDLKNLADAQKLARLAIDHGELRRFEILEPTLDEIFIETVKKK